MTEPATEPPVAARRLVVLAVSTQAALAALAAIGGRLFAVPPRWGSPVEGVAIGLAAAFVLAAANYGLLACGRRGWFGGGVWTAYREVLVPLFGVGSVAGSVVIGTAAGVGEEWFFRGFLQPLVGWVGASVLFGAAHVGGRRFAALGVWAAVMGMVLGGLADWSGGLIAPMVAHGTYDVLALEYIRRTAGPGAGPMGSEEQATT
ncbi:MAG: lysostaphin resistance A-like protein [Vicinamibacterales bacterium]